MHIGTFYFTRIFSIASCLLAIVSLSGCLEFNQPQSDTQFISTTFNLCKSDLMKEINVPIVSGSYISWGGSFGGDLVLFINTQMVGTLESKRRFKKHPMTVTACISPQREIFINFEVEEAPKQYKNYLTNFIRIRSNSFDVKPVYILKTDFRKFGISFDELGPIYPTANLQDATYVHTYKPQYLNAIIQSLRSDNSSPTINFRKRN